MLQAPTVSDFPIDTWEIWIQLSRWYLYGGNVNSSTSFIWICISMFVTGILQTDIINNICVMSFTIQTTLGLRIFKNYKQKKVMFNRSFYKYLIKYPYSSL